MLTFYTNLWRGKYDILFGLDSTNCIALLRMMCHGFRYLTLVQENLAKDCIDSLKLSWQSIFLCLLMIRQTLTFIHTYTHLTTIYRFTFCATFIPITTHKIFQDSYILKNIKMLYRRKHNIQWSRLRNTFDIIFLTWQICQHASSRALMGRSSSFLIEIMYNIITFQ